MRKKCPNCSQGPIFEKWLKVRDKCPNCGTKYLSDQGDLLGVMILVDRVIFLVPLVTFFCLAFPNSSPRVYIPIITVVTILLIFTMPNRTGLTVAFDYYLNQKDADEVAAESERNS